MQMMWRFHKSIERSKSVVLGITKVIAARCGIIPVACADDIITNNVDTGHILNLTGRNINIAVGRILGFTGIQLTGIALVDEEVISTKVLTIFRGFNGSYTGCNDIIVEFNYFNNCIHENSSNKVIIREKGFFLSFT